MNLKGKTVWMLTTMIAIASSLQAGNGGTPIQTPEPATLLLFAAGAVGVGLWRRRAATKK